MSALTGADVKRGDILLCKSFAVLPNLSHGVIRVGQNTFRPDTEDLKTPLAGRTFTNSVHAAIALSSAQTPVQIAESTHKGLTRGDHEGAEAYVFRLRVKYPNAKELADAAGDVADDLVEWTTGKAAGRYNYFRSAFSVLGRTDYGDKAKTRIRQIEDRQYDDGFFCSMLATVCYQVAADYLKLPGPPIEADPVKLSPAGLETYMRRHSDVWACIGILNRPPGNLLDRWKKRWFTNE